MMSPEKTRRKRNRKRRSNTTLNRNNDWFEMIWIMIFKYSVKKMLVSLQYESYLLFRPCISLRHHFRGWLRPRHKWEAVIVVALIKCNTTQKCHFTYFMWESNVNPTGSGCSAVDGGRGVAAAVVVTTGSAHILFAERQSLDATGGRARINSGVCQPVTNPTERGMSANRRINHT